MTVWDLARSHGYLVVSKDEDFHRLMRHIVRPLLEAKQCYILRMPVACIAQAGLVGDMVALWRFRMLQSTIDGRAFTEELQKLILGRGRRCDRHRTFG
jgi:Domain of unknown function (DUF5615)